MVQKSALNLFLAYCDRYPEISIGPVGFGKNFAETRFYLEPIRDDKPLGLKPRIQGYPYVDVLRAGIEPQVAFKSGVSKAPAPQMNSAYSEEITSFLEGRQFFMKVDRRIITRDYVASLYRVELFPIVLSTRPAIKRGLVINPEGNDSRAYLHWTSFFPRDAPEYDAIMAAVDLERVRLHKPAPSQDEVGRLTAVIEERLAHVSA